MYDRNENKIKNATYVPDINKKIKVETDGEYIIKITVIDEAGNRSENTNSKGVINIGKDNTPPEVGEPVISENTKTDKEFTVSIAAKDEGSGIDKYEYYVNGELKETKPNGVCKIDGLKPGTEYEVYVIVYDKAGNSTKSMTISTITREEGWNNGNNGNGGNGDNQGGNTGGNEGGSGNTGDGSGGDDTPSGNRFRLTDSDIGKIVNYVPANGASYTAYYEYTGGDMDLTFNTEETIEWKLFDYDDTYISLISSSQTKAVLPLYGWSMYNNGVYLCNKICEKNYMNSSYQRYNSSKLKHR